MIEKLNIGIQPITENVIIIISSAIDWIKDNTKFVFDYENAENIPASIKLFILKFYEIMSLPTGISSESIEGLSQSFDSANKADLIWQCAREMLKKWLLNDNCFISASKRW